MATISTKKHVSEVISKPHITEKASVLAETGNVYTFQVTKEANKRSVAKAIKEMFKVDAVKVAIVNLPAKKVFTKGKSGSTKAIKKAYIYLKKGYKIELI